MIERIGNWTPGTWKLVAAGGGNGGSMWDVGVVNTNRGTYVVNEDGTLNLTPENRNLTIARFFGVVGERRITDKQGRANVALFLAAPKLYTALADILIEEGHRIGRPYSTLRDKAEEALNEARKEPTF